MYTMTRYAKLVKDTFFFFCKNNNNFTEKLISNKRQTQRFGIEYIWYIIHNINNLF